MNTLLDIAGSIFIGSLLLLSLSAALFSFSEARFDLGRSLDVQKRTTAIAEMITADLNTAGTGVPDSVNAVITADSTGFMFIANAGGNGVFDTTRYSAYQVQGGTGDNMPMITRHAGSGGEFSLRNAHIRFTYFDEDGSTTDVPSEVRSVETLLSVQDDSEIGFPPARSFRQWHIFLKNIIKQRVP